ncbi:MAG: long-chain fatty acid--CoA ligase [Candidatus Dadabacteria bacterium]|nr:long-chain fatty acid--CoA ligase [Candidatus Dadabacteria bacterium]MYA47778.1 long-chain fatty acid--CoA ligase [Candidatus Dadabacteria bacterium]MYG83623.1 long-chain fatty acid--CoA ligase [Candidatus Dadabacteria bacterium]MYK48802.1 long-chain fatty acid--CoA ligase [Candidatus Dadabacteria bacterium]
MQRLTRTEKRLPGTRSKNQIATIQNMLERKSSLYADKIAYSIRKNDLSVSSLTFSEVFTLFTQFSAHLMSLGLKRREHVAIVGENSPQWAISYFAVIWAGAIVVPLDARARTEHIKQVLVLSDSRFLIASAGFTEALSNTGTVEHIIPMDEALEVRSHTEKTVLAEKLEPEDIADIVFTSGTTGNPKGVMLSHASIMSNLETLYSAFPITVEDTAFSILPIHHVYERIGGILLSFYCGQRVFFSRSIKPREMLSDLKVARPTVWLNTPLILERLLQRIEQNKAKNFLTRALPSKLFGKMARKRLGLDRLKLIVSGGAALSEAASRGLEKYEFPLLQGYGMSETAAVISANPFSKPKNASGGMVLENSEVEIRDTDSEGIGEICVRGASVMKGYYKNPGATREILSDDGWLRTGDLGYFDHEGYLYITGRKKSVIVTRGGKNISPEEIEEKLTPLETIEEAIVFSPDDERIQAVIFPEAEGISKKLDQPPQHGDDERIWDVLKDQITELNRRLEPHKRISHFAVAREELPKTTTRKVKRYLFRDMDISKTTKFIHPPEDK